MNIDFNKIKGYDKLDDRRQSVVRNVLAGMRFTRACQLVSLNTSREKANAKLQAVLYHGAMRKPEPPAKAAEPADRPDSGSIYARAAALEKEMESWPAERRAEYDAEQAPRHAEADAKALADWLAGKVCKGCAKPAELKFGTEPWCRTCREIPRNRRLYLRRLHLDRHVLQRPRARRHSRRVTGLPANWSARCGAVFTRRSRGAEHVVQISITACAAASGCSRYERRRRSASSDRAAEAPAPPEPPREYYRVPDVDYRSRRPQPARDVLFDNPKPPSDEIRKQCLCGGWVPISATRCTYCNRPL